MKTSPAIIAAVLAASAGRIRIRPHRGVLLVHLRRRQGFHAKSSVSSRGSRQADQARLRPGRSQCSAGDRTRPHGANATGGR